MTPVYLSAGLESDFSNNLNVIAHRKKQESVLNQRIKHSAVTSDSQRRLEPQLVSGTSIAARTTATSRLREWNELI